jgi:phosphoglycerate dehydrogenase-like enzyme
MNPRVALLDDYQNVALSLMDLDRLRGRVEVTAFNDHLFDEDALVERLMPFTGVAILAERTPFRRSLIARLPNLRLIVTTGMRNRSLDLAACEERGITVCGTQSNNTAAPQATWALLMALAQQITVVDRDIREGRWQTGLGEELTGKTVGLLGLGKIGSKVAQFARAFDMNVLAWSANLTDERAAACGAERVERDDLLRRADFVSIHLQLSDRTRGLLQRGDLGLMKPTAYLVNTSRGPIVDEAALIDVLQNRRIAGAGLDVFDIEPLPLDHPLRRLPNTVLTPHIGYVTRDGFTNYFKQLVESIEAWLDGKPVRRIASA